MKINFKEYLFQKNGVYILRQVIFSTYVAALLNVDSTDMTSNLLTNSSIAQQVSSNNQSHAVTKADQSETVLQVAFSIIAGSAFVLNLMFCVVLLKMWPLLIYSQVRLAPKHTMLSFFLTHHRLAIIG